MTRYGWFISIWIRRPLYLPKAFRRTTDFNFVRSFTHSLILLIRVFFVRFAFCQQIVEYFSAHHSHFAFFIFAARCLCFQGYTQPSWWKVWYVWKEETDLNIWHRSTAISADCRNWNSNDLPLLQWMKWA